MIVHEGMVADLPVAGRPRRQARRDLRRPGRRAVGARRTSPTPASASSPATTAGSKRSRSDQADALIYDYPFAAEEIKAHPRTVIVKYNLNQSKYAVGIPEGNYDLVYEVNRAIDQFKATPQYADLMREYLSSSSEVFMKPVAGRKTYTVKAGRHADARSPPPSSATSTRWKEIWDLNRDRVANENLIYPRLVLLMP